jgi:hypothetical protein
MEHLKPKQTNKLSSLVQDLNHSLTALQPNQSETTRLITYALLATAVVGVAVYHYIKDQERSPDSFSKKRD